MLVIAVAGSHVELARLLINQGAYVDYVTKDGFTPLRYAVQAGHVELAQLLIGNGACVNQTGNKGFTPLYDAATKGYVELSRLLIYKGADVSLKTKKGFTPLSSAAEKGHVELIRLLIDKGADVNVATYKGTTPLYFAVQEDNDEVARLLISNEIVRLLLANGADPEKKLKILNLGRYSFTKAPLSAAIVNRGDKETVEMIEKAIRERKIHSSSECSSLRAGQNASYGAIR
ncbi:ankyrin repeat domain-containing protein [Endozoicomonas sp. GU-1]|uniref:ankyrin repeat domain-containing protein n=1 Tax=Endozoicomonas sp. GU-1 TaxID=3009078 RepID=UPI0022B33FD7|nr:ankyrin repeat domain-containing protein [Endozoicomonas sp. GU-1]WBA87830.1 ankyrin repeat domain-containing protein [Endozoicomonas sp. GU-1]